MGRTACLLSRRLGSRKGLEIHETNCNRDENKVNELKELSSYLRFKREVMEVEARLHDRGSLCHGL